ncbi:hypothetical protein JAAARDRAFT_36394 [Jaapia argillacea MUCL 33604]|uniref:SnoaL-like domain-containing protein n=1 Tax=Jaapia argillacea MUCL 33604 TaxID=933084 RepID=A0A067Q0T4_9AGAM|nr:hypothetical protein JAAARDRAFT_36394 [Jaapia argillacea MUCL 33604]
MTDAQVTSEPTPTPPPAVATPSLPDLTTWVKTHLAAVYEATEEDDLRSSFEMVFAPEVEIHLNHELVSRDEMRDKLMQGRFAASSASLEWKNVMCVPKEDAELTGLVAGYFVIDRTSKFRIRAAPAHRTMTCTFSAKIDDIPSVEADEHGDKRRIVHMFQTSLNEAAPIHFARPFAMVPQGNLPSVTEIK